MNGMELILRLQIKYNHDKFKIELNKSTVGKLFAQNIDVIYLCRLNILFTIELRIERNAMTFFNESNRISYNWLTEPVISMQRLN